MRPDLVAKALADAESERGAEGLPEGEPKGRPVGVSGVGRVRFAQEVGKAPRLRPWQAHGLRDRHLARVATVEEGAAVLAAYEAKADRLAHVPARAMRQTVKRLARQMLEGQGALPLGDGLDDTGPGA